MNLVDLLKRFLKSQRTVEFRLYIKSMQEILPFLAATGHNNYVKSIHIHLQDMLRLEDTRPHIYEQFDAGLFVVRRSNRLWADLPRELIIDQVLMRSIKTTGGLTPGRGLEEKQRPRWLLAMPACAEFNEAMQEATGAQYVTSDQHKDLTVARKERDHNDTLKMLEYFQEYSPFVSYEALHNIATGITASASCNQHKAEDVGVNFWNVNLLRDLLGDKVSYLLHLIHAVGGCDTTSRLYVIGKGVPLRKVQTDANLCKHMESILDGSTSKEIQIAGEGALVSLYGGMEHETLDSLRLQKFKDKVVKSVASVQIQNLPPTSDAAKYHSYRVMYQAKLWMGKDGELKPDDWGWKYQQDKLVPRTMDCQPAPESVLKVVRCQCKGNCSNNK